MKFILIFGVAFLIKNALSDELSPPEPLRTEARGVRLNGPNTETKEEVKKYNSGSDYKKQTINVKPATPIISGGEGKATVQQAEPTVRSVKSSQPGEESNDGNDKKGATESKPGVGLEDLPQTILDSVKQDEKSLRGGNTEIKPEKDSESKDDSNGDKSDQEKPKIDPILESIEGAEKQLSEAFSAVRTKIMTMGKGQEPIKVDCGTTRVRVVCTKKGEPELTESPENREKIVETKPIIEPKPKAKKEAETEKTEEKAEGEKETEKGEVEEITEQEEE